VERDPSGDLRGALTAPQVSHRAAIVDPAGIGALLRAIDSFDGQATTRTALHLAAYVFVRPFESMQRRNRSGLSQSWYIARHQGDERMKQP
jgi:hypothetical protein